MRQLPALRRGRRAWVIGDPDVPRSWTYLPDVAATLAVLGTDERALGRAWHVPTNPPRSQREAIGDLARALGRPPVPVSGIPWPVLRAAGVAVPFVREVVDVRHQFDQEYVLDATATTETLGLTATPWDEVVAASVAAPATARA
jgi:nucleoside-diphosphate-sugar epimerase